MIRVFLSHSHLDNPICERLVKYVQHSLPEVSFFFDKQDIEPSSEWMEILQREIVECDNFLVVLSSNSVISKWVRREINTALREVMHESNSRHIIPFKIEVCNINLLSTFISNYQMIDSVYQSEIDAFEELLGVLKKFSSYPEKSDVIEPTLVPISKGSFIMGNNHGHETFVDTINIDDYSIGKYPVTVEEFACYVKETRRVPKDWGLQLSHLDHPAVNISWFEAVAYCRWISSHTNKNYRLPTEAEWEKAARWDGEDSLLYPWGNKYMIGRCNTDEEGIHTTSPVTFFESKGGRSPYGVQDLAGNVWEWCSSLFSPYPYRKDDGREDLSQTGRRIQRGGSWRLDQDYAKGYIRGNFNPDIGNDTEGFRLVLSSK